MVNPKINSIHLPYSQIYLNVFGFGFDFIVNKNLIETKNIKFWYLIQTKKMFKLWFVPKLLVSSLGQLGTVEHDTVTPGPAWQLLAGPGHGLLFTQHTPLGWPVTRSPSYQFVFAQGNGLESFLSWSCPASALPRLPPRTGLRVGAGAETAARYTSGGSGAGAGLVVWLAGRASNEGSRRLREDSTITQKSLLGPSPDCL